MEVNHVVRGRVVFPGVVPVMRVELRKHGFSADRISRLCDPVTRFAVVPRGAQRLGSTCNSVTKLAGGVNSTRAFYFGHHDYPRRRQSEMHLRISLIHIPNRMGIHASLSLMQTRESRIWLHRRGSQMPRSPALIRSRPITIHPLTSRPVCRAIWLHSGLSSSSCAFSRDPTSAGCQRTLAL